MPGGWRKREGVKLDVPKHGYPGYRKGCRCLECREGNRLKCAKHNPKYFGHNPRGDAYLVKVQRETKAAAVNAGNEWTGPELELLARKDLTVREVAEMLGRSYQAARTQRTLLNKDPRKTHSAGVADDGS